MCHAEGQKEVGILASELTISRKTRGHLKELGQIHKLQDIMPVKDWRTSRDGGPRKVVTEDLRL